MNDPEPDSFTPEELEELRAEIQIGLDQLEAGEGAEWDVEEHKARLRQQFDE
jgi:hypothetical protein